ncbi:MAG: NADH-quinone oxidoreductase subunit I [Bacteroidota bacterium]|nr:NADH-quinone oxidoreductase subunit I [Bacteroidota bacterium]
MSGYFKNIKDALWTVLVGMGITWKHMFMRKVTFQYPNVKRPVPERARCRLYVRIDDCIGCEQCAKACPVHCIEIETVKALPNEDLGTTSTGTKKRLWVTRFDIDFAKCCFCGLCVFPCPTACIRMTGVFEFSEYRRSDLMYRFSSMTHDQARMKKEALEAYQRDQEAKKTAAAVETQKKTVQAEAADLANPSHDATT